MRVSARKEVRFKANDVVLDQQDGIDLRETERQEVTNIECFWMPANAAMKHKF